MSVTRHHIRQLIAGKPVERCGFWLGNPDADTWPHSAPLFWHRQRGRTAAEDRRRLPVDLPAVLRRRLPGSTRAGRCSTAGLDRRSTAARPLAHCQTVEEVEAVPLAEARNT